MKKEGINMKLFLVLLLFLILIVSPFSSFSSNTTFAGDLELFENNTALFEGSSVLQQDDSITEKNFDATAYMIEKYLKEHPTTNKSKRDVQKRILKQGVLEYQINDTLTFWAYDFDSGDMYQVDAKLVAKNDVAYGFVATDLLSIADTTLIENLLDEFRDIYLTETTIFGDTNGTLGDIDGDPHVFLLFLNGGNNYAGYYDPTNDDVGPYSNEKEMLYINYMYITDDPGATIAHEFNHLILFNHNPYQHRWIAEGLAEIGSFVTGYFADSENYSSFTNLFLSYIDDSLIWWDYDSQEHDVRIDYGMAYLFMLYLGDRFGWEIYKAITNETTIGADAVENAVELVSGTFYSLHDLFIDWITALLVDDPSLGDGRYGLESINVTFDAESLSTYPITINEPVHEYGLELYSLDVIPPVFNVTIQDPALASGNLSVVVLGINETGFYRDIINTTSATIEHTYSNFGNYEKAYIYYTWFDPYPNTYPDGVGDITDVTLYLEPLLLDFSFNGNWNYDQDTWILQFNDYEIRDENNVLLTADNAFVRVIVYNTLDADEWFLFNLEYGNSLGLWSGEINMKPYSASTWNWRMEAITLDGFDMITGTFDVEHYLDLSWNVEILTSTSNEQTNYLLRAYDFNYSYTQEGTNLRELLADVKFYVATTTNITVISPKTLGFELDGTIKNGTLDITSLDSGTYNAVIEITVDGKTWRFYKEFNLSKNDGFFGIGLDALSSILIGTSSLLILIPLMNKKKR